MHWILIALAVAPRGAPHDVAVLPPDFELIERPGEWALPVDLEFVPGGGLLVAERSGRVLFAPDGEPPRDEAVLDIVDEVNENGDRGLLALALHPGFVPDGGPTSWLYCLYTVAPIHGEDTDYDEDQQYSFSRLARWRVQESGGALAADPASRHVLLGERLSRGLAPDAIASLHTSHSNGSLCFASDGTLIVSTGDGAHYNGLDTGGRDPAGFEDFVHPVTGLSGPTPREQDSGAFRAQDLRSLAGKILRIDPETGAGLVSNPFFDGDPSSLASRVFALGLRNPFRVTLWPDTGSTDPADGEPETIVVGDVGWGLWEELDLCEGGENFGWPCREGPEVLAIYESFERGVDPLARPDCAVPAPGAPSDPVLAWHHGDPALLVPPGVHRDATGAPGPGFRGACAIGGTFYAGGTYPAEFEGRLFFADFVQGWIKSLAWSPDGTVAAVHDFAEDVGRIVAIERDPATGDLFVVALPDTSHPTARILWLRYSTDPSPIAVAEADPASGPAPLTVQFDGSGSWDPFSDPLEFRWDFGDGSAPSDEVAPLHTYRTEGLFHAALRVTDPAGGFDVDTLEVEVGEIPPVARILAPLEDLVYDPGEVIQLVGEGESPSTEALEFEWEVDLVHDVHEHPAFHRATGPDASFGTELHAEPDELFWYRVRLIVRDDAGLEGRDAVAIWPRANYVDVAGTARITSRMEELVPPFAIGEGADVEVIRDGDFPRPGMAGNLARQYDSFHEGDQGEDDWIGYELSSPPHPAARFVGLAFVEGVHQRWGGWFESLAVEVRREGVWEPVERLRITPEYSFVAAADPFFDGVHFERYELRFAPAAGDAIRLRGDPGGTDGFLSVGELRAHVIAPRPSTDGLEDVTAKGAVIARVLELSPPGPTGGGNPDPGTIKNGTRPPAGTTSAFAQFDTFHEGGQSGEEDWIGYRFATPQRFARLVFQEGLEDATGGWLGALAVQVQAEPGGEWSALVHTASPPYPGDPATPYETFVLDFPPTEGVAIRVHGVAEGSAGWFGVGELRVLAVAPDPPVAVPYCFCDSGPCGNSDAHAGCFHAEGLGARLIVASGGASLVADDLLLQVVGLPPGRPGLLFVGNTRVAPWFGDGTRCVGGVRGRFPARHSDPAGRLTEPTPLASWAAAHGGALPGTTVHVQCWYRDPPGPCGMDFNLSSALSVTFVP